ncbi:MAG: penicillin-binding transpeptidase domain-containing protein, partial [Gemmatimonadales bacterium]|nr:penicillin-binding transpeptidase domain-containing protein [Gemmatimonadales bacterium]
LADTTFLGIRRALIAVVERGTARGARLERIQMAGKTGTAQNPHGLDHGWFIGFAPADNPAIVVGGIMEFAEHGTTVAPYVARVIEHFLLGPDSERAGSVETEIVPLIIPEDSAPRSLPMDSLPADTAPATPRPRIRPRPRAR